MIMEDPPRRRSTTFGRAPPPNRYLVCRTPEFPPVRLPAGTAALAVLLAVTLSGCGSGMTGRPTPRESGASPVATGSGGAAALPPTATPSGCATGRTVVNWLPERPSPGRLCVRGGAEVVVVLHAPDAVSRWQPPVSSDPGVAEVGPAGRSQEGAVSATVYPRRAGTAVIGSYTVFSGDPHGPVSRRWQLTLDVVP
jgi:hypothetical protein